MLNLDQIFCSIPAGLREELAAYPKFVAVPDEGEEQRWMGFKVAIPIKLWREYFLPHIQALLDGPVKLFGQTLRAYGWSAMIMPATPIKSIDQCVWVEFNDPIYHDAWRAKYNLTAANNLTCAPGAREFLAQTV